MMTATSPYNQKVSLLVRVYHFYHYSFMCVSKHLPIPCRPTGRHLSTHRINSQTQRQSQMNLCGSRGTGGVISFSTSTNLTIFDLEEDEENDSSAGDDGGELSVEEEEE